MWLISIYHYYFYYYYMHTISYCQRPLKMMAFGFSCRRVLSCAWPSVRHESEACCVVTVENKDLEHHTCIFLSLLCTGGGWLTYLHQYHHTRTTGHHARGVIGHVARLLCSYKSPSSVSCGLSVCVCVCCKTVCVCQTVSGASAQHFLGIVCCQVKCAKTASVFVLL